MPLDSRPPALEYLRPGHAAPHRKDVVTGAAAGRTAIPLNIKQRLLGHNHPDVAMTLHNLAMLYSQQGDHDRARAVFARAVGIFESSLGPDYPKTARSRTELDALVTQ